MQRMAACLASWFSVDGPLSPDGSAPLNVNQFTKLNTADSPLTSNRGRTFKFYFLPSQQGLFDEKYSSLL